MNSADIRNLATRAVSFDSEGNAMAAIFYYRETARLIAADPTLASDPNLSKKAAEYLDRAKVLEETTVEEVDTNHRRKPEGQSDLERAYFLFETGLNHDEDGNVDEAVENYLSAIELCLKTETEDADLKAKLSKVAEQAVERAEILKGRKTKREVSFQKKQEPPPRKLPSNFLPPLFDEDETSLSASSSSSSNKAGYSEEEKRVLAVTSLINGREYVPFLDLDLKEKFAFPIPFTDKHGKLKLSPKQRARLVKWVRPEEFLKGEPKILEAVDCFSVKQTVVSDCSFVASIAVAAQYEKRFSTRQKLITSLIFPRNRAGKPVYNPCGKYMVKLRINGVPRKVVIDDYFPLGQRGEPLCSYSSNRSELWISLLEKAYLKVMGGYDFPGSNSNIDLYALTGWIPERVSINVEDPTFNKDAVFRKIFERFHKGDVLVTIATGEISELEGDRAGLVPTHAYAMLDIREVKGVKLFSLKNPWSHLRWRGNYSELDMTHWTPELKKALNYDPQNAANFDNGVFWIDYESLLKFFDVIYLNWNLELFKYTFVTHQTWKAGIGPVKDMYDISSNPQFSLEIKGSGSGALWILLSRHITEIEDFKDNKEYITVLVYKNDGKKVYYPFDPPPYIDGVRINSPHYLCQSVINDSTPRKLTLVISQYEKSMTIHYSLRVFCTLPVVLKKIGDPYKFKQEVNNCEWKGKTAGGCANYSDTYPNNPKFQIALEVDSHVLIELKGPKQYQIGFDIVSVVVEQKDSPKYFRLKQSGPYRSGFVVMAVELLAGTYDIVPTTFRPGQESPFFLTVRSSSKLKLGRLQ